MSLQQGTRLGTYEITGPLGAGGMGEVYRARDTKLGRDVAIKTLPAQLATDKERLARFEREAKLLAALNHPHIAAIYGLDEHAGTLYLAMELVEGITLEEKLKPGALSVEEALPLALQIAEALEAAHGKGVVHRDLKPANIMVSAQGQVKVLDFGLAKNFGEESQSSAQQSPALSLAMTQAGLILGTAGYMSPEQASGQATDQRADIWSFGVVLYEMLSGLPLFRGESVPHILADVLKTDPDWKRLPQNLHPRLRLMLERCLAKKPRYRYHAIADARVDIELALRDPAGAASALQTQSQSAPVSALRRFALPLGLALGAVIAGSTVWFATLPEPPAAMPLNRFSHELPTADFRRTGRNVLALAPDGRHFVVNTEAGFMLRSMDAVETRVIPGTEPDLYMPFFSADGQSIGFLNPSTGELKRIALWGGASVTLAQDLQQPMGADWTADGTILVALPEGIVRVPASGGTPELVIPAENAEILGSPQLLPDGDKVLFTTSQARDWDAGDLVVASLSTGERTVVLKGGHAAHYVPTGHLVYVFENTLFGIAFDLATLQVNGGPVPLVQGLSSASSGTTDTANYGIAADGTLAYLANSPFGQADGNVEMVWVDHAGQETATGMPACSCDAGHNRLALAPDGTRAAVVVNGDLDQDIWIWSFTAETLTRLTFEPASQFGPVWTPDSQRLLYELQNEGLRSRAADGTGSVAVEFATNERTEPGNLDPAGNLVFKMQDDIYLLDRATGMSSPLLTGPYNEERPVVSPDGRYLAYESNESGKEEVYVRPYPDVDSGKWQVSTSGGARPRWSPDGSRLYFLTSSGNNLMEAVINTAPVFNRQTPTALFAFSTAGYRAFDISADGERFLVLKIDNSADVDAPQPRVMIVQNWVEELKRVVPVPNGN